MNNDNIQIGTILYTNTGWECTRVNYYQVVKLSPKGIIFRQINKDVTPIDKHWDNTSPRVNDFIEKKTYFRLPAKSGPYKGQHLINSKTPLWIYEGDNNTTHQTSQYGLMLV